MNRERGGKGGNAFDRDENPLDEETCRWQVRQSVIGGERQDK